MNATHPDYLGVWCPTCKQDCLPLPNGRCGFCDTRVTDPEGTTPWIHHIDGTPVKIAPAAKETPVTWTQDEIVAAIKQWAADHGRPPTGNDWAKAEDGRPTTDLVKRRFGSWADAVEAAGFPRPQRGVSFGGRIGKTTGGQSPAKAKPAPKPATTTLPPPAPALAASGGTLVQFAHAVETAQNDLDAAIARREHALEALRAALEQEAA